jgi:hypothetical protein
MKAWGELFHGLPQYWGAPVGRRSVRRSLRLYCQHWWSSSCLRSYACLLYPLWLLRLLRDPRSISLTAEGNDGKQMTHALIIADQRLWACVRLLLQAFKSSTHQLQIGYPLLNPLLTYCQRRENLLTGQRSGVASFQQAHDLGEGKVQAARPQNKAQSVSLCPRVETVLVVPRCGAGKRPTDS